MRRLMTYLLIMSVIIGYLGGCRRPAIMPELKAAEAFMDSLHPDTALTLLKNLDTRNLRSDENRARYALLMSMALHKNDIDVTDDSLISIASKHYENSSDLRHRMLSTYYHGYIFFNAKKYNEAMVKATQALDRSTALNDTLFIARSHELIAEIHVYCHHSREPVPHLQQAINLYKQMNLPGIYKAVLSASLKLANVYMTDYKNEQAIHLADSVMKESVKVGYNVIIPTTLSILVSCTSTADRNEDAIKYFNELQTNYKTSSFDHTYAALAYYNLGQLEQCREQLSLAAKDTKGDLSLISQILMIEKNYYRKKGDYRKALELADSMHRLEMRHEWKLRDYMLGDIQRDYFATKSAEAETRAEIVKSKIRYTLIFSVITILLIFTIMRLYIIAKNHRIENQLNDISRLKSSVSIQCEENASIRNSLNSLFKQQFASIDALCEQYFESEGSEADKKLIYDKVSVLVKTLKEQESAINIENIVNSGMDNIMSRLRADMPSLSEGDIRFIACVYARFSPRSVCLLTGLKLPSYYSKKKRLIIRLHNELGEKASEYTDHFN